MSKVDETGDISSYINFSGKKGKINNISKLTNLRIIQKQLVYVIGLSFNYAFNEPLSNFEYFGQYGKITKLVVNKNKVYNANGPNGPSYSAYVTYNSAEEASLAILSLDNSIVDNHLIRASYGTTKYCSNFLRGTECFNKDCLYLHYAADENDIIERDDMNTNKSIFLTQHYLAMKIADVFNEQVRSALEAMKANRTFFPTPASLYDKEIVKDRMKQLESEKEENSNSETIKFNSSNAMYDSKSIYSSKSFLSALSQNQHLQSKNAKNHYASNNNFLNQISPLINPISLQTNPFYGNNRGFNINNNNNNNGNLFKSGLIHGSSNSFNLGNNPISSFSAFFSSGSSNTFTKDNSINGNYINSNNNNECKVNPSSLIKNNNSFVTANPMNYVYKENSINNNTTNNSSSNMINNNSSSQINLLYSYKNGGYFNSQLSESNFNLNSFKHKNSSLNLIEKSDLAANESTYFENNATENSFLSNFNSIDSITRKSSYNYDSYNLNNNKQNNNNHNNNNNCNSKNQENCFENSKNPIFSVRKNSRFFDVEKDTPKADSLNTTSDSVHVPNFISELLSRKISKFSFFKKFAKDDEEIQYDNFLLKEIDENHEWARFIYSFGTCNNYEEFSMLNKFNSA